MNAPTVPPILYATGNDVKFLQAQHVCEPAGIRLQQQALGVPELQSDDAKVIVRDKAAKAFAVFGQPLVVSDDSWSIPKLKGFPGPYMKYINDWFSVDDWLNLTRPLNDRRIRLTQYVAYIDKAGTQVFDCAVDGVLLGEARGKSAYPHSHIVSFDGGKHSDAEAHAQGRPAINRQRTVWHEFAEWYRERHEG